MRETVYLIENDRMASVAVRFRNIRKQIKESWKEDGNPRGNFINVGCMMPWMNYTPRTLDEIIAGDKQYENTETDSE